MISTVYEQGNSLCYSYTPSTKPPLLCLHGLNLSKEIFQTKKMQSMLEDYNLILIDLCGYGDAQINASISMDIFDLLLQKIIQQEHLQNVSLCGYCLGGVFALDYTIRHPEQIAHLMLIETMIYLPSWMWMTTIPGYAQGYAFFQHQTWLLHSLSHIPAFAKIADAQRISLSDKQWKQKVNTRYLKLMHSYEKIDHVKRSDAILCPVDVYYSTHSFHAIIKTADAFQHHPMFHFHQQMQKGHFFYLD